MVEVRKLTSLVPGYDLYGAYKLIDIGAAKFKKDIIEVFLLKTGSHVPPCSRTFVPGYL